MFARGSCDCHWRQLVEAWSLPVTAARTERLRALAKSRW